MTPYELTILLEVYVGKPISADKDAPIYNETMRGLMVDDMWIRSTASGGWEATEKLKVFLEHVLNLPAPVQEWRMPQLAKMKKEAA